MNFKNRHLVVGHVVLEFLLLNLCLLAVFYLQVPELSYSSNNELYLNGLVQLFIIFNLSWAIIVLYNGSLDFYINIDFKNRIKYLILNTFIFVGVTYTLGTILGLDFFKTTTFLLPIFLFSLINLSIFRLLFEYNKRRRHDAFTSQVLVVGASDKWDELTDFTEKIGKRGYRVMGFVEDGPHQDGAAGLEVLGGVQDLSGVLEQKPVDEIFIALSHMQEDKIRHTIAVADYHGVRVNLVPDTLHYLNSRSKPRTLEDMPVFRLRQSPLDHFNNFLLKKSFDVVFSLAVLAILFPLFAFIGLLIYLDGKGPVFYTPLRKGEGGGTFKCYKFRTMSECDDPVNGTKSTKRDDPRITWIGKYLRKYDLDELPQFYNVLKGDMSVVGPRPHRVYLENDFRKIVNDYMVRHYVKPGITGWAQVNGWRGPTVTREQKVERVKHDLWYIENWSFGLDLRIIYRTVFSKKTRKNAF